MASHYEFNRLQLIAIAGGLGDLLPQVTFVGGCATALLVDDVAFAGVRQTDDVDVIVDITTQVKLQAFSKQLRQRGFREDVDGPICRWKFEHNGLSLKLDVMPTSEKILGFSNRWYVDANKNSVEYRLQDELSINVVTPVYFLATKFEAFIDRGKGDYFSHDMEDIVFVMENRRDLIRELMEAPAELKAYFAQQAKNLLNERFLNVLPGLLLVPTSISAIQNQLKIMASW